jgi:hypothetical protein
MSKFLFLGFLVLAQSCRISSLLPDSYIDCDDNFSWTTGNFDRAEHLNHDEYPHHAGKLALIAQSKAGSQTREEHRGNNFFNHTEEKRDICIAINRKINGEANMFMEFQLYQILEPDFITPMESNKQFKNIDSKRAILKNFAWDSSHKNPLYNLQLEISISCENPWKIKGNAQNITMFNLKEPEGKCYFSLHDHELDLPSGQKVLIALSGFYEHNPARTKNIIIEINNIGFKNI